MKPKLLIVGSFPTGNSKIYGGIATTCKTLVSSSFKDSFKLVLIDSTQRSNPPPRIFVRSLFAFRRFLRFSLSLFWHRPDAVLLFAADGASILEKGTMAWLAKTLMIPVFLFPRAAGLIDSVSASGPRRVWVKIAMRGATHILCQGASWQRFATNVLGFHVSKSPIIFNWSATNELLDIGGSRTEFIPGHRPQLLFLGWLEKEKGIFELLHALLILSKRYCFILTIAGRGHAEMEARDFVKDNNMEGVVEFVGWVEGAEKNALMSKADILVLPSWAEGFPNVIIEAMASKIAVIVSRVGTVPDIVVDKQQALLVAPKSIEDLMLAFTTLLDSPAVLRSIANKGYDFARNNFSVEMGAKKMTLVIQRAIEEVKSKKS